MQLYKNSNFLLILGGGRDQNFAINRCKNIGIKTLVIDFDPKCIGRNNATIFAKISNRDSREIIKFIEKNKISLSGIFVQGTDIPHVACVIANHFNLSYMDLDAANLSIDKFFFKKELVKKNINVPEIAKAFNFNDTKDFVNKIGFPVVIKPNFLSGSKGVFYIDNFHDLEKYFLISKSYTDEDYILIEEYIKGIQISTESIITNKKINTYGIAERNYEWMNLLKPYIIENGGIQPWENWRNYIREINKVLELIRSLLSINNGGLKGDLIIEHKTNEIFVLECATRFSGGDFCESIIPLSLERPYMDYLIRNAVLDIDIKELPKVDFKKYVANRYFVSKKPGKVIKIYNKIDLNKIRWLKKLKLYFEEGDHYGGCKSHSDRLGVFIVESSNIKTLNERINYIYNNIKIEIQ